MVPVIKQNGFTVNELSHMECYTLPRMVDIFSALSGGKLFMKLDLFQAYLLLEVDDSCNKLLTIFTHKGLFVYSRLPFGEACTLVIYQRG